MDRLYMDLGMGAEKEKICAALFDLLTDEERGRFVKTVEGLGLEGVSVRAAKAQKSGISGSEFAIVAGGMTEAEHKLAHAHRDHDHEHEHVHAHHEDDHDHDHDHHHEHDHHENQHADAHAHHHEHVHRGMPEIRDMVGGLSGVSDKVKSDILGVYDIIAAAEAEVHGSTPEEVHFHEVGEMYAIATVTSYCILMDMLGVKEVYASPVRTGKGMIECAHGLLPVPAPATAAIIRDMPVFEGDVEGELTTPTGAAMVKYFADGYGDMPDTEAKKAGYGFGVKELSCPDVVKVTLHEQ